MKWMHEKRRTAGALRGKGWGGYDECVMMDEMRSGKTGTMR